MPKQAQPATIFSPFDSLPYETQIQATLRKQDIERQYETGDICYSTYRSKKRHFEAKFGVYYESVPGPTN